MNRADAIKRLAAIIAGLPAATVGIPAAGVGGDERIMRWVVCRMDIKTKLTGKLSAVVEADIKEFRLVECDWQLPGADWFYIGTVEFPRKHEPIIRNELKKAVLGRVA